MYLANILIFCGILLLLALTVAVVQGIVILIDVRRVSREVTNKVLAITSLFDIVTMLVGGLGEAKKRVGKKMDSNTVVAFAAGLKKAVQVLFKK
jgi:hypothetical protein